MPPKAAEKPADPDKPEDTVKWGAFITVEVPTATLSLVVSPPPRPEPEPVAAPAKGGKGAPPPPPIEVGPPPERAEPATHWSISYSGEYAPVKGQPTKPSSPEHDAWKGGDLAEPVEFVFEYAARCAFRHSTGTAALQQLLNTRVVLSLHDSASGSVLGSTPLDMLPFAMGKQRFDMDAVVLEPAAAPAAAGDGSSSGAAATAAVRLVSASIPKLTVSLTERKEPATGSVAPAPAPPAEAAAASEEGGNSGEGEGAAAAPAEPAAPDAAAALPYRYVSEADAAEGAGMVTLSLAGVLPVPASLQAAADTVGGKDGTAGTVMFQLGVALPSPGPALTLPGRLVDGALQFSGPTRFVLSADGADALRTHLEGGGGLAVELARYVQSEVLTDNTWEAYHGCADIPGAGGLLEEGETRLACGPGLALGGWAQCPTQLGSCLPGGPSPPADAKAKQLEPGADPSASAWGGAASAVADLTLAFARPLVPVWAPPPPPGKSVPDLVPTRDLCPPPPTTTAAGEFRDHVLGALSMLASAYADYPNAEWRPNPDWYTSAPGSYPGERPDSAWAPDPAWLAQPIDARHQGLIFDLNHSGAYESVRDSFKSALVGLAREELGAGGGMSPLEMTPLYSKLYARAMDLVHTQLAAMADTAPKPAPPLAPSLKASDALLARALEYETAGLWLAASPSGSDRARGSALLVRCEQLHQAALVDRDRPSVWHAHGASCARRGELGAALASARGALEVGPTHAPSLLLLAACSLESILVGMAAQDAAAAAAAAEAEAQAQAAAAAAAEAEAEAEGGAAEASGAEAPAAGTAGEPAVPPPYAVDADALEAACVAATDLLAAGEPGSPLPWALLSLAYALDPQLPGPSRANGAWASCRAMLSTIERSALSRGLPPAAANGHAQLGDAAGALALARVARAALAAAPRLARSYAGLSYGANLGAARDALACGRLADAAAAARVAARAGRAATGAVPVEPVRMQADAAWRQGRPDDAVRLLQGALRAAGPRHAHAPVSLHLHLGEAFLAAGQPRCCVDHLSAVVADTRVGADADADASPGDDGAAAQQGASSHAASPLLWLLAGRGALACGDAAGADVALTEANLLDPELPEPWGLLALLSVKAGRWGDARAALGQGRVVGLANASVLGQVAEAFEGAGRWGDAAGALEWALSADPATPDAVSLMCRLAGAHVHLGNARIARELIERAGTGEAEGDNAAHAALLGELSARVESPAVDE
ncbi:hypothetical protein FOA52_014806 [Chlamydomonas sp. UWO 241]|nr:hypothetical protein FOA52_014806 [Chlamydomonas sp. UWO 241]